jgi:hypothetical protein
VVVVVVAAGCEPAGSAADSLHELILSGYELLYLRVVGGVVGVAVAGLTVAWIVPCVHHLRDFDKRDISNLDYML